MLCFFFSCTEDEFIDPKIKVNFSEIQVSGNGELRELNLEISSKEILKFNSDVNWMTIVDKVKSTKSETNKSYFIKIEKNATDTVRQGNIKINLGNTTESIKVTQAIAIDDESDKDTETGPEPPSDKIPEPGLKEVKLTLSNISAIFPNTGGKVSCYVDSDTDWNVALESEGDWCSFETALTSGNGSGVIVFTAESNPLHTRREATLKVATKNVDEIKIEQTLTIYQEALSDVFILSTNELTIGKVIDSKTSFTIESSFDWTLNTQAKWFSINIIEPPLKNSIKTIELTVNEENTTGAIREEVIFVMNGEKELAQVKISQNADELIYFVYNGENVRVSTYQPNDGSIEGIFDGDVSTYFTSNWAGYVIAVPQWIVVDLGEGNEANHVSFKYTTRDRSSTTYTPSKIKIEATTQDATSHVWAQEGDEYTDSDRTWTTLSTYEGDVYCPKGNAIESPLLSGTSDVKCRYWRFYVDQAIQSPSYVETYPNSFCFNISELKVVTHK